MCSLFTVSSIVWLLFGEVMLYMCCIYACLLLLAMWLTSQDNVLPLISVVVLL